MQLCNSYGIFFNSIYNPTERLQLFIKVSFKTNGPRYLQYVFSFLVLKKPLQKIKKKQDSLLLSIFLKHPTTQKMSLMTHRHFLVLKNPSPLTLHTRYVILLYQLHYCINLILNHRKSRTCLIELFKVSLTQHIYTNYQLHNCINLLILITHLNCYELNACIVLAFYIFGYYHYIKQGPTVQD